MKNNKLDLFKKNNRIIDSKFDNWDLMEYRLLNSLLFKYWKSKDKEQIDKFQGFITTYSELRELMEINDNKNYKKIINHSLEVMKSTPIVLNHFNQYKKLHTSFVFRWGELKDDYKQSDKNQKVVIKFDTELFEFFLDNKNFTYLDIKSNKLRSKYSIRLYELIKMKSEQHNPHTKEKNFIKELYLDDLNDFFGTNHRYISLFKQHLEKSKEELIEKSFLDDLHIEYFKDRVHFIFNQTQLFDFVD